VKRKAKGRGGKDKTHRYFVAEQYVQAGGRKRQVLNTDLPGLSGKPGVNINEHSCIGADVFVNDSQKKKEGLLEVLHL